MQQIILAIHVLAAIGLVSLVLLQYGKGADVGAAFGSGASNTMFGSQSALPFLLKVTAFLAAIFFATSLTLGYLAAHQQQANKNLLSMPTTSSTPATNSVPTSPKK